MRYRVPTVGLELYSPSISEKHKRTGHHVNIFGMIDAFL
jgi:hypothetical protein